jgi:anti-sigma factor RsiW
MHEKLDGVLSEELTEDLYRHLAKDSEAAREYERLETVDTLLTTAPQMRAPQRLAVTIMARLAQSIEMQAKLQSLPVEVRDQVMQSLSLSMMATMPLMVGASWVVLNAMGDPALLVRVMERVVTLMYLLIDAQLILLEEIEPYLKDDPKLAAACLQLLPSMMLGLMDAMEQRPQ